MQHAEPISQRLNVLQTAAVIIAVLGIILGVVVSAGDLDRFFQVYLYSFLFLFEISIGCLGLLMLQNLFDARWGWSLQRPLAAGARTLPLIAVLFVPLLPNLGRLYEWTKTAGPIGSLQHKDLYLYQPLVIGRSVFYFVVWIGLAIAVTSLLYSNDDNGDREDIRRAQRVSVAGLILLFITASLASFDWVMSLNKDWYSSVYGWLSMSRHALSAMAVSIVAIALYWRREPLARLMNRQAAIDVGTLLLVTVMVWFYLNFFQYIIMWSGNLPAKVMWYADRSAGGWVAYAAWVIAFHAIAFVILLIPGVKRTTWIVMIVAAVLIGLRLAEMYWIVMPTYYEAYAPQLVDFVLPIGMTGLWVALFLWTLKQQRVVPVNHPQMPQDAIAPEATGYVV